MNQPLSIPAYEAAMRRALELAAQGPRHGVNPQVGCVVLNPAGEIIAEGWHRGSGTDHAEIDALKKLSADQLSASTFVVTLEPCNHTGKTGPCAQALIDAGISRVVYGATDPGHASSGGAQRLRDAGIDVMDNLLKTEVESFLEEWMLATRLGRPHVTIKWASSLDGRAAANDGTSQWISGASSRARVHEQRSAAAAIIVGTGTVLADDPSLTARQPDGSLYADQPIPVVIGERAISPSSHLFSHPQTPLVISHRNLEQAMNELFDAGIRSVFVEGGPQLASAFIAAGLADRFYIYLAPVLLGGEKLALGDIGVGTLADRIDLSIDSVESLGADIFITAHPQDSSQRKGA